MALSSLLPKPSLFGRERLFTLSNMLGLQRASIKGIQDLPCRRTRTWLRHIWRHNPEAVSFSFHIVTLRNIVHHGLNRSVQQRWLGTCIRKHRWPSGNLPRTTSPVWKGSPRLLWLWQRGYLVALRSCWPLRCQRGRELTRKTSFFLRLSLCAWAEVGCMHALGWRRDL